MPRLIIYLFVFNKNLTFSVKLCTGKITIVFQVESSYYCWVLEVVIKSSSTWRYLLGWLGSEILRWGPPFPGGRGAGSQAVGREEEATRSEETQGSWGTVGLPAVGE